MDKIAVLIPCYNEAQTIAKVIGDVKKYLPEAAIYVYNNNSKDDTAKIAEECGAIVRNEYKQGKGNVIRRMFREIEAQCYLMIDGDDTYPLESAPEMVRLVLERNSDMVVGDRLSSTYFTENKRPFHNFGNSLMRWGINSLFRADIRDIMTGYRAMSYDFVKTFPVFSKGFEIETEMTIHAVNYNLQVDNVVVEYRDRPKGSESKLNTLPDGMKVIRKMFSLYKNYKPMEFFGLIATVLMLVSLGFMVPIVGEFAVTGEVPRFPTLITCGFVFMAGLLSLFTGMILKVVDSKDRKDFEYRLMRIHDRYMSARRKDMA
ncbi:MAG: glycosyltransferase family 2 protein [Lachnospiraceae bacterium]|nr:glycosyltransferase family 2 protein [Lachnospiraceae bacterium]